MIVITPLGDARRDQHPLRSEEVAGPQGEPDDPGDEHKARGDQEPGAIDGTRRGQHGADRQHCGHSGQVTYIRRVDAEGEVRILNGQVVRLDQALAGEYVTA